ncbi:MAG: hypothetical protein M3Y57_12525 [Acidobacteriota bacterium]|nr:hypothetical protein [Acidobacteriota bacterium]
MTTSFRGFAAALLLSAILSVSGCSTSTESEAQRRSEANSAAGKLGQAAHNVAVHTEKAAKVVGRKLDKAAHQAHEGWEESARKDNGKK